MKPKKWIKWWFWSAKPESENWAQTLVRVSGNLIRLFAVTPLFLIVIGVLIAATPSMVSERQEQAAIKKIEISVWNRCSADTLEPRDLFDEDEKAKSGGSPENRFLKYVECTEEYPLCIGILNKSRMALQSLTVKLEARRRGSSANVLSSNEDEHRFDAIVLPSHSYGYCIKHPKALEQRTLVWSGTPKLYSVNLSGIEDWMIEESESYPLSED